MCGLDGDRRFSYFTPSCSSSASMASMTFPTAWRTTSLSGRPGSYASPTVPTRSTCRGVAPSISADIRHSDSAGECGSRRRHHAIRELSAPSVVDSHSPRRSCYVVVPAACVSASAGFALKLTPYCLPSITGSGGQSTTTMMMQGQQPKNRGPYSSKLPTAPQNMNRSANCMNRGVVSVEV